MIDKPADIKYIYINEKKRKFLKYLTRYTDISNYRISCNTSGPPKLLKLLFLVPTTPGKTRVDSDSFGKDSLKNLYFSM